MATSSAALHADVAVTVQMVDGTEHVVRVAPDKNIGLVRRRAALPSGPRLELCCDGTMLADGVLVRDLPAHRRLTGWYPRYSRSDEATNTAAAVVRIAFDRRRAWRYAQAAVRVTTKVCAPPRATQHHRPSLCW